MAPSPCSSSASCLRSPCRRSSATTRARAWRCWPTRSTAHPSGELDVVGVTGTNGKTTTTMLLAAILDAAARPCGLLGTVERRIGGRREAAGLTTPEAPDLQRALRFMLEAGDEACAMEASSIAIAQRRLVGTEFAAVGFTNLSQDHLDFHGDLEALLRRPRPRSSTGASRARSTPTTPTARASSAELRFGVDAEAADVRCEAFELRADRTELFVRTPQGSLSLEPRLRGRFNVDNVLCAVTLALLLDVPLGAIERAVAVTGAAARPLRAGRGGPGLRRDRRLRAHARRHRRGAGLGAPARRAAACCACSAPAATATTPSARSWARRPRPAPTGST